jgi:hypothetical protein
MNSAFVIRAYLKTPPKLMVQTFTQNEIIKAIYHELPADEMVELENQLETDQEIENNLHSLNVIKTELNNLMVNPSDQTVANILSYSRSYKK